MTRKSPLGLRSLLLLVLLTAASLASYAQSSPRITQAVDQRSYVTLGNNTRAEANALNYSGAVAPSFPVDHILLFLQRSPAQEAAVDQYINSLNDRNSPNFHQWLTPEQFGEKFGVDEGDIQQVTNWLQSEGFQINQVYPNRMAIDFSGTAGQISQAFRTKMGTFNVGGKTHIANTGDPQIPAALAPVIRGFASLNDFRPNANHISAAQYTFAGCSSSSSHPIEPGTCYAVTPQDNAVIYNLNPLWSAGYSGQGQTIGIIEDTNVYNFPGDWNTYRSTFGLSGYPGTFTQVHPGCTDPGTNADDGEAAIDVEVASGIAPSAAIKLLACPSVGVTFGGLIAFQNMLNLPGPYPGVVSVSYGVCEAANGNGGNAAFYYTYQQAAAQGISVFTSSGDEGASSCSRNFTNGASYFVTSLGVTGWGGTPYDVSVGGTDFEDVYNAKTGQNGGNPLSTYWSSTNSNGGSAKSYIPEIPWNDACASTLIAFAVKGSYTTAGASGTGFCNTSPGNSTSGYLSTAIASGGASNCATGAGGSNTSNYLVSGPQCQGYPKPDYQTGAALTGGKAVYGMSSDGVRNVPDVSMFAANGAWSHYEVVCWSDPSQTSAGAASCSGAPSSWSGFGGTSVSAPTMAGIQALVNQKTGQTWGVPLKYYYQIGQNEYGTAGGSFQGASCNASGSGGPGSGCVFNDVTQGDIDAGCRYNGTTVEHHCYKPAGTNGVASTDNVTGATVINGGSGYTSAPTCTIAGPTNSQPYKSPTNTTLWAGGTQATCTAAVNTGTTTAVWTVVMASTSGVGDQIVITNNAGTTTCGPYTLSGTSTALMASNLNSAIGTGCALATSAVSGSTVTITARIGGYSGNVIVGFGTATLFNAFYVTITNTTLGQGPNYVSGITITGAGSGYQPETPITLAGGGGSGAIAVANTTIGTPAQSYQPAYGAGPGYDLATGLGTPNAYNLANSSVWAVQQPQTITFPNPGPLTYGTAPVALGATATSGLTVTYSVISGPGSVSGNTLTVTGAGTIVVQADQAGNSSWLPAPSVQDSIVVSPAAVTATAGSGSSVYDGATHSPSACVVSGTYTGDLACTNNPSSVGPNAGTTSIAPNVTGTGLSNYNITTVNGSYTISQASSVTTVTCPPSVTYTGAAQTPCSATVTGAGGLNQSVTVNYTNNVNAGTASASASFAGDANHTGSSDSKNFTINQAAVTATAGSGSSVYNGLTHSPSACVVSGAYTGNLSCTNNPTSAGPNVGTTTVAPNVTGTGLSNFSISSVNGSYSITAAGLTVTAGNGAMAFGGTPPVINYTSNGWVNGEGAGLFNPAPTCVPNVTSSSIPGTYASTCSGAAAPNYTISYVSGTVTVAKAKVTVSITSHTPNPSIHGQGVTVSFKVSSQTSGTPTGSVTISASSGETCTGVLSGGTGSCVITPGTAGKIALSPFYTGDSDFSAGPGTLVLQQVN